MKWKNSNQYLYEGNFIWFNQSLEHNFNNGDLDMEKKAGTLIYDHLENYFK